MHFHQVCPTMAFASSGFGRFSGRRRSSFDIIELGF